MPSLISVPQDERSLAQITDDSLDLKPSENEKVMRWPLAVPALREPTPPQPSDRVGGYASLDFVESRVVAVLGFSDPTTEPIVRGYAVSTPTASVQHTRLLDGPEVPDPRPACCVEACIGA